MKPSLRFVSLFPLLVLVAPAVRAHERPHIDAYYAAKGENALPALDRAPQERGKAVVTSVDPKRGVPSFLWAAPGSPDAYAFGKSPEEAARTYLERYAATYRLSQADVADARVAAVHDTGRGGIVVAMRQRVGDVDVFRSDVKLLLGRDQRLLAIAGAPHATASHAKALAKQGAGFALGREQALASAFSDLFGYSVAPAAFRSVGREKDGYRYYQIAPAAVGLQSVSMRARPRVKQVYFPLPDRLVPAYFLELEAQREGEGEAYAYVVSAVDGSILYRSNLVAYDSYNYRAYVDDDPARHYPPADSPFADASPQASLGPSSGEVPGFGAQALVSQAGFNQPGDPWLPPGATVAQGNNVKAYADHDAQFGYDDINDGQTGTDPAAETTGPNTFDYSFDPNAEPLATPQQIKASITQLFYTTNWLHDYWYDSGFDEASGVAQNDNYGRAAGGDGDAIEAQAQDKFFAGFRNNANMMTPSDGASPRMQMFVWTGTDDVHVTTSVAGLDVTQVGTARFGPKDFTFSGAFALVNDGAGEAPGDGCEPFGGVAGKIALVNRGTCSFSVKVLNAQAAGALGVVVVSNDPELPPVGMAGTPSEPVTIGSIMISYADGAAIKAALGAGSVTAKVTRDGGADYDGSQDNTVVAHEWGHYLHHRLVLCASWACDGMSEGWGDLQALMLSVKEGDDTSAAFAVGAYATVSSTDFLYFGVRRYPYSTDLAKNPLTFKHIASSSELPPPEEVPRGPLGEPFNFQPHNLGEWWASALFEGYANLLAAHPFDEAKRRMADYVVGGMKLTPIEPTFTQQRDAVLAYTFSQDKADYDRLAAGFAKRGLGVGAVSPEPDSILNDELVENFDRKGVLALGALDLDDSTQSCDGDGVLDAGETGRLTVAVRNVGMATLDPSQITVTSASPGVEIVGGTAATATIDPYGTLTVGADVKLAAGALPQADVTLDVTIANAGAFNLQVTGSVTRRSNLDEPPNTSAVDTIETRSTPWAATGAASVWGRRPEGDSSNHLWHADDVDGYGEGALESPDIAVGSSGDFVLKFDHAYKFESAGGAHFDGGVLEVKETGGEWVDVHTLGLDPGYSGAIDGIDLGNPLAGRPAFVETSAGYPGLAPVTVNFGQAFAGKTVRFRFRVGTDASLGAPGWDVDNVEVVNGGTPFPSITDDVTACAGAPAADAGPDQTVIAGSTVSLDASHSASSKGGALAFAWTQHEGPAIDLAGDDGQRPTFIAPVVASPVALVFNVRATDGAGLANDSVTITVVPKGDSAGAVDAGVGGEAGPVARTSEPQKSDNDKGCNCSTTGEPARASHVWLPALAAGLALVRRRRRVVRRRGTSMSSALLALLLAGTPGCGDDDDSGPVAGSSGAAGSNGAGASGAAGQAGTSGAGGQGGAGASGAGGQGGAGAGGTAGQGGAGGQSGSNGVLDPTFGDEGILVLYTPQPGGGNTLTLGPDDRFTVAHPFESVLERRLPDGAPDPSFGVNGRAALPETFQINRIALQPDGKTIAVGEDVFFNEETEEITYTPGFFRINADGTPDIAYGAGGFLSFVGPTGTAYPADIGVHDGRLLVVGDGTTPGEVDTFYTFALRMLPDGSLDTSYHAPDGFALWPSTGPAPDYVSTYLGQVASDGSLYACGYAQPLAPPAEGPPSNFDVRVTHALPDGGADPTFGQGGVVRLNLASSLDGSVNFNDVCSAIAMAPDGKLLISGNIDWFDPDSGQFASVVFVARLLPDGSLDPSFGDDGIFRVKVPLMGVTSGLLVLPDGSSLVGGSTPYSASWNFPAIRLMRVRADGTLDRSFADDGFYSLGLPNALVGDVKLARQSTGKILVRGVNDGRVFVARLNPL